MCQVYIHRFLDAAAADREFRRAIELDPNLARAHHWYATFLIQVLRFPEGLAEIERARQLDPSSKAILADKGGLLLRAGRREEGAALLKQMEASDPTFRSSHEYLATLYWDEGNYEDALDEFRKEALLRGADQVVQEVTVKQDALRTGGGQGLLQYQLSAALRAYEHENGTAFKVATAYGQLRQRDDTMKFLQLARQHHEAWLAYIELTPELRWLRIDPEFRQLVVDLGLPALP